jgi:hypothetical protein
MLIDRQYSKADSLGRDIAVQDGLAYVTGSTNEPLSADASSDYPTTPGAFDTTFNNDTFATTLPTC